MRKIFTLFFVFVISTGTLFAEKVQIGDLYYNINPSTHLADVTWQFSYPSDNYSGLTTAIIPPTITYDSVDYTVTRIGEGAFHHCSTLKTISIPSSVTFIYSGAFDSCSGLTNITIPSSVTDMGEWVFVNCSSLVSIVVEEGNPNFDSRNNCNAIITSGNWLITGCKNTIIPEDVIGIGEAAFYGCTNLTNITIPNSVTWIQTQAFYGCTGLTKIAIGNNLTTISIGAFDGCSSCESISVMSGNTKYDSRNNCNAIIETASNSLIMGCKNTIIPNSVTNIGSEAFYGCSGLTSVTIPNSVTSIGQGAFYGCSGLTCVICEAVEPPTCSSNSFSEVDKTIPLYVPCDAAEAYAEAAVWKDFTNIEECVFSVSQAMETYNLLSLEAGAKSTETYTIRGYVTKWKSGYPQYQNADFFIDDTETGSQVLLEAYRLNADNDADKRTLIVGDFIEATAYFKNNSGNAQLVDGTFHVVTPGTPPEDKGNSSIADFISTADTKNIYHLTGTVSGLPEDRTNNAWKYGNFNLTDATGTIYIYGLLTADSVAQQFSTLDIENEDEVTLKGVYTTNNGTPQIANAIFISRTKHQDPSGLEQIEQSPMGNGKFIKNGQLFIQQGDKTYNAQGARVE